VHKFQDPDEVAAMEVETAYYQGASRRKRSQSSPLTQAAVAAASAEEVEEHTRDDEIGEKLLGVATRPGTVDSVRENFVGEAQAEWRAEVERQKRMEFELANPPIYVPDRFAEMKQPALCTTLDGATGELLIKEAFDKRGFAPLRLKSVPNTRQMVEIMTSVPEGSKEDLESNQQMVQAEVPFPKEVPSLYVTKEAPSPFLTRRSLTSMQRELMVARARQQTFDRALQKPSPKGSFRSPGGPRRSTSLSQSGSMSRLVPAVTMSMPVVFERSPSNPNL
jgi:hypothetical protein